MWHEQVGVTSPRKEQGEHIQGVCTFSELQFRLVHKWEIDLGMFCVWMYCCCSSCHGEFNFYLRKRQRLIGEFWEVTTAPCPQSLGRYVAQWRAQQLFALNWASDIPLCLWFPADCNVSHDGAATHPDVYLPLSLSLLHLLGGQSCLLRLALYNGHRLRLLIIPNGFWKEKQRVGVGWLVTLNCP